MAVSSPRRRRKKHSSKDKSVAVVSRKAGQSSGSGGNPLIQKKIISPSTKVEIQDVSVEKISSDKVGRLLVGQMFGGNEVPTPAGYQAYSEAYMQLAWVYAAFYAVATGMSDVPWNIWDGPPDEEKGGKKLTSEHPAVRLFEYPNDDQVWTDFVEAVMFYLELAGDEYIEVARTRLSKKPSELYTLRPDRITIMPEKGGRGIQWFRFRLTPHAKNKIDFPPKDIIHFQYFNPFDDWYGLSTLSAAALATVSERYTIAYNQNFFKNDATPSGYLYTDEKVGKTIAEEIGRMWRQNMGGVGNAHRIPLLPRGLKFSAIGMSPRDMMFLRQRQYNREEILAVVGVPPVKVGLLEHAKYDTYSLQESAFFRDTIQPKAKKLQGTLTRFLKREFGESLVFRFDMTDFLAEDKNRQADRLVKLFVTGAFTPNDIIREIGVGEVYDEGNEHYVSAAFVPVGGESLVAGERQSTAVLEEMKRELGTKFAQFEKFAERLEEVAPQLAVLSSVKEE